MKKIFFALLALATVVKVNAQACSGAPAANTAIASSTNICPGNSVTLTLQNAYTATGIVYQWASSTTSSIGPWAQISGANNSSLVTTAITQSGWYTAVIACSNSFMTATATAVYINVGSVGQTTTAPYYESFENPVPNGLPNCGWTASSLGVNCISFPSATTAAVPASGLRMLGFSYSATALGPHEFFTQGFNLLAGVIYSVNVGQSTNNFFGANNWSQFGIGIGTTQAAAGGTVVYSTNNPNTGNYLQRSTTFTVPANGVYYVRIFATAVVGTTVAPYLTFDDLSITIPCTLPGNQGTAIVTSTAMIGSNVITMCQKDSALVNFSPGPNCVMVSPTATSVYINGSSAAVPPGANAFYYTSTNSISGCTTPSSLSLVIKPTPSVAVFASSPVICAGTQCYISAVGGNSYTLVPGNLTGNVFGVTPQSTTVYTLIASNIYSCSGTATVSVLVNPKPQISLGLDTLKFCAGETSSVAVSGASSYTCSFTGVTIQNGLVFFPALSNSLAAVITGANAQQCVSSVTVQLKPDQCAGITQQNLNEHLRLVPNPAHDFISITYTDGLEAKLYNLQGQLIQKDVFTNAHLNLDVRKCVTGIYYLVLNSATASNTVKIVVE